MNNHVDAFIGIDYGTTTCKLAYITPPLRTQRKNIPSVDNISFNVEGNETSKRFPSSVLFETKGKKVKIRKGFDVQKIFKDEKKLNSLTYQLVNSPKLDLGKGIFYPIAPPEYCEPEDLVYLTLDEMIREFEKTGIKRKNCKVIVTVPSSFGVQQRKEMLKALDRLGIDTDENILVDEPNAALLGLIPSPLFSTVVRRSETKNLLLMDFGGGTCDISLLKINEDFSNEPYGVEIQNLAINDYAELGGNKIDYEVAQIILQQIFNPEEYSLFNEDILKIEAADKLLDRLAKTIGQKGKEQIVSELSSITTRTRKKAQSIFSFNIERIKILFKTLAEPLLIPRKNKVKIDRAEFEEIIKRKIIGDAINIDMLVNNVVDKAGLEIEDVGSILLAGGSSRIFQVKSFKEELLSIFPHLTNNQIISDADPDLLISKGAAIECYNRFFLNRSLIRPICPSNIGIRTAEEENVCLIPAGKGLPYPNQEERGREEIMYVPNTRNKNLKVPLYIERFGYWNIFQTWDITLPPEVNPSDRLLFKAKMRLDKTLEVSCRAYKDPTLRFNLTSEDWLSSVDYTPRERKINELRLKIRYQKKVYDKIQFDDLYDLIWEEYEAKYYSIVKKRCLSFLETDIFNDRENSHFYNYLGLLANNNWKYTEAIQFYKKALELNPKNSIYNYNIGVSYLWNTSDSILAEKYLLESLNYNSDSFRTHYYLGEAKLKNHKEAEAKKHFREALSIVKEFFSKVPDKINIEYYCKTCDQLGLEYPQELKNKLANRDHYDEKYKDTPVGLSNTEQIVRLNPDYSERKVNDEEE